MSVKRLDQDNDADENVDADHVRTVIPVESEQTIDLFTQREDIDIDFRVSGLPHAVVKQAENFRVRELVKKIESHPHRRALQADLQQNNAYNPFSEESKAMIREMGNVELFELRETIPKVQCSECLLSWNQGIVHCNCGHLLRESESSQHFNQWRLDALSIPHYVIKKGRPRGARHGKTEAQKEYDKAHNPRKRCLKRNHEGIHDTRPPGNPPAPFDSVSGLPWNPNATGGGSTQSSTGRFVARSDEQNWRHNNAEICKETINQEFSLSSGKDLSTESCV